MMAAPALTLADHALNYANRGALIFPCSPVDKAPLNEHGMLEGTTNAKRIGDWWRTHPSALIGCRIPEDTVILDIDPRHGGDTTWDLLCQQNGDRALPTRHHASGRGDGGNHRWYLRPNGRLSARELHEWARAHGTGHAVGKHSWTSGIDLLHYNHRYTILPPSPHPETGKPYKWLNEERQGPMPSWLASMIVVVPKPVTPSLRVADTDSIADWYSANHTWNEILGLAGWVLVHSDGDSDGSSWRHPSATASQSCSIRHGCLFVYTPNTDFEETEHGNPNGYTRFRAWAILQHDGDLTTAARAARELRDGPRQPIPTPTVMDDGQAPREPKHQIIHNSRQLDDVIDDAVAALDAHNNPPTLFVRGGVVARVREDEEERPIIETMRAEHMRPALAAAADWYRMNKDGASTPTFPPLELATTVIASGNWPFPPLAGVAEMPVVRPDGVIVTEHGYDSDTRLYHWHRGAPYKDIPDAPTAAELVAAVALVDDALCDFPWDTTSDRANAWGLLLTPLIRPLVPSVPMALVDAPEPGTGKGLLVKVVTLATTGRQASMMAWPTTEEELAKTISSKLVAGGTMVIFDNVEGMIKSPTLAMALTTDVYEARILGRTENLVVPQRATWIATGNNIDVGGDLARRCYRIRLDARQAQPWKRTGFKHEDLETWIKANRTELLHALCVIVKSWWTAGRPMARDVPAMGGYTSWVRTIGGILEHAGIGDFLTNLAEFHASADREAGAWEAFLTTWAEQFGEEPTTVAEVNMRMKDSQWGTLLRDTLPDDLAGHFDTGGFARRLGQALRKRTGRHYGDRGLHLIEMPKDRRNVVIYSVTERSERLTGAQEARVVDSTTRAADPVTSTSSDERGFAGSSPYQREPKTYPQEEEIQGVTTPQEPAEPNNPRVEISPPW